MFTTMKKPLRLLKKTTLLFFIAALILAIILLGIWTESVYESRRKEELRLLLESVIAERGELGLFDLAGIPTESLNYGNLDLYLGGRGAWTLTDSELSDISAYEKAKASTVQIISSNSLSDESQASGVIITGDGYIVTNYHVLGKEGALSVNFYDGTSESARIIGYDSLLDIAVIKTEKENLSPITFSEHSAAVGSRAIAIGHPYGYAWSMSAGVISGLERTLFTSEGLVLPSLIQTDNFINPGNSGGPLLDSRGDMIGLILSIYSTTGRSQAVSFAIPAEIVKRVAGDIIERRTQKRGMLDVTTLELNAQIASYLGLDISQGIMISEVISGGNAESAGLRGGFERAKYGSASAYLGGDVIVKINGSDVRNYSDYFAALFDTKGGDVAEVTVCRSGRYRNYSVTLAEQDEESMRWILR